MKRLFLAIHIPITSEFESYYKKLQHDLSNNKMKWVEEKNLHLTLQFFGKSHSSRIKKYIKACEDVCSRQASFETELTQLGVFGSRYAPRVVWMGMSSEEAFKVLKTDLLQEFEKCGYKPDRQNFVPHLTLARIKEIQSKPYFQKVIERYRNAPAVKFEVKELFLYESILHKEGPEYKVIKKFSLQNK